LNKQGSDIHIIENCLNGRRTVWNDPYKSGRNGSKHLAQVIEMHSPLSMVILMLGTNDFQRMHNNNAWLSAQGTEKLINIIRQAPIEPGMPSPEIMVVAPPTIIKPKGTIAHKFKDAEIHSTGLAEELEKVTKKESVFYFNANTVTEPSVVDGIHLDKPQHEVLGKALAKKYLSIA
jgi:lysophospholipase L1-like esterase